MALARFSLKEKRASVARPNDDNLRRRTHFAQCHIVDDITG